MNLFNVLFVIGITATSFKILTYPSYIISDNHAFVVFHVLMALPLYILSYLVIDHPEFYEPQFQLHILFSLYIVLTRLDHLGPLSPTVSRIINISSLSILTFMLLSKNFKAYFIVLSLPILLDLFVVISKLV
jgi:hypothetical protein